MVTGFRKIAQYGRAFAIHEFILLHVTDFQFTSFRLSKISLEFKNKGYTLINCHAPTNNKNYTNQKQTDQFWTQLDKEIKKKKTPNATH